ncbi:MAG: hypothetical protein R3174_04145 [Gammaproteobacteria bacterium]|nr:hypothetical protein [Gammaproteobacteria bacterium]
MNCPNCGTAELKPGKLEHNLPCLTCGDCNGALLPLVAYRYWRENFPAEVEHAEVTKAYSDSTDTEKALLCPKCRRIMLKFRFATDVDHGIDVCSHCQEVWLDEGEWHYLRVRHIHGSLPSVFTDPWQKHLREQRTKKVLESEWRKKLGEDDFNETEKIHQWLKSHPNRSAILAFLISEDPYQA